MLVPGLLRCLMVSWLLLWPAARATGTVPDADFGVQGEYWGQLSRRDGGQATWALQVVAGGEGRFSARLFAGGLPGHRGVRTAWGELAGQWDGPAVVLSGHGLEVRLADRRARVFDRQGRAAGTLVKVRRSSRTLQTPPPPGAIRLFDGSSPDQLVGARFSEAGHLLAGAVSKMPFGDFRLHLEFRTPYRPQARGQDRGNSGLYIQQRYEVQILDSFGLEGAANECGALYRQQAPALNACLPPLAWQTYDIEFQAARFDHEGRKRTPARITVLHNGIPIHVDYALRDKTGAGRPEGPDPRPLTLQDHGNPVEFRNVWIAPRNACGR